MCKKYCKDCVWAVGGRYGVDCEHPNNLHFYRTTAVGELKYTYKKRIEDLNSNFNCNNYVTGFKGIWLKIKDMFGYDV